MDEIQSCVILSSFDRLTQKSGEHDTSVNTVVILDFVAQICDPVLQMQGRN